LGVAFNESLRKYSTAQFRELHLFCLICLCVVFAMAEAARLLTTAFRDKDCKAVRLYAKRGYDCRALDPNTKYTLLHLVMRLSCTDCDKSSMAQSLIKAGNPVDARDMNGVTPLMLCRSPALAEVLDHGADINASSVDTIPSGFTCLMLAVASNNLPVVQLLLSRGASVNAEVADCKTPLQLACDLGHPAIAKALLAASASATDQQLMHAAILSKHTADTQLQLLHVLLQHGAPVDEVDADGATPLIECVGLDASCLIADMLLKAGADVNAAKTGGAAIRQLQMTALHFAAYVGSPDTIGMLKLLLAAGASTSSLCCSGCLPLHNALRDSGCDASEVGPTGSSPIA
jgi:ankyrin repeat protein